MRFLFPLFIMALSGCAHYPPPEIVGQRIGSSGEVVQKIIRAERVVEHTGLGPCGPRQYSTITCRFYCQDDGNPQREFVIVNSRKEPFLNPFLAVTNSPLWITYFETIIWTNRPEASHIVYPQSDSWPSAKPYTSYQVNDLDIYVFDTRGFCRHRTFMTLQKGDGKFVPEGQMYAGEFTFEDGNQTMVFKSPKGLQKYNVMRDTVTEAEPNEKDRK
jgi:hypothetical protein